MEKKTQAILIWTAAAILVAGSALCLGFGRPNWAAACALAALVPLYLRAELSRREAAAAKREAETEREAQRALQEESQRAIEEAHIEARAQMEEMRSLLSHQIRMPLAIVQGYADMLARDMVDDEDKKKEILNKISEHTQLIADALGQQLRTIEDKRAASAALQRIDVVELL